MSCRKQGCVTLFHLPTIWTQSERKVWARRFVLWLRGSVTQFVKDNFDDVLSGYLVSYLIGG